MKYKRLLQKKTKKGIKLHKQKNHETKPKIIVLLVLLLSLFGLVMIFNVSSITALSDFADQYYYLKQQAQWLFVGIIALTFFTFFDHKRLYTLALPIFIISLVLLFAVFIPGVGMRVSGAARWINFGFFIVQPSELSKLSLIIYLSAWLSSKENGRFTAFLLLIGMSIIPVVLQPDLGTAVMIVAVALSMYFLSGAPIIHLVLLVPFVGGAAALLAVSAPYRLQRVMTFLNSSIDPEGASYHVRQILIAIGSGGLSGVGLGKSRQKFAYLPEVTTDSIFAVIGEETGFIGATLLIAVFVILILMCFRIVESGTDRFSMLLASGITLTLSYQIIINLAAMVSLVPLTGIPLPFLSYGGSNLIISFIMIGILVNIARSKQ